MRAPAPTPAAHAPAPLSARRTYSRGGARSRPRQRARPPRRVSGPSRGASAAFAVALVDSAAAIPRVVRPVLRPVPAPHAPRRTRPAPARRTATRRGPKQSADAVSALLRVADHGLLDRLIRGRVWIGLVGFALIGIVAMQLVVLRLNTQIGHELERKANLQREISATQVADSALTSAERVQTEAGKRGMELSPSGVVAFVAPQRSDAQTAAQLLSSGTTGEAGAQTQAQSPGTSTAGQEAPHG